MSGHENTDAYQKLCKRIEELGLEMRHVRDYMAAQFVQGEWERFRFDGKAGIFRQVDDRGSNALSYAVYNPNEHRVFVGIVGGQASSSDFVVPKQKLVVMPAKVNGAISLLADEGELGEKATVIWRVRFPTPQAFAAYSL